MKYDIQFKPKAVKDIEALPLRIQRGILARIEAMSDNLKGDIKKLVRLTPEHRLRIGDYRVLFEIENETIVVYRVRHRREAYR